MLHPPPNEFRKAQCSRLILQLGYVFPFIHQTTSVSQIHLPFHMKHSSSLTSPLTKYAKCLPCAKTTSTRLLGPLRIIQKDDTRRALRHLVQRRYYYSEPLDLLPKDGGGYCPVHHGQVFNSRYEVRRKLGWGSYASVWVVKDNVYVLLICLRTEC